MGDAGGAVLVDQVPGRKAIEGERRVELMRPIVRDRVRKGPSRPRRGLESAGAPAAIEIEVPDRRHADDRTRIGAYVDDAAPLAVHAHAAEDRKQLDDRRQRSLDDREAAALAIADVG